MNILIIEDDQNKIKQIVEYVKTIYDSPSIIKRFSFQSGLKEIINSNFDIIILDMSMPTFDITENDSGGRPKPFAGREILRQMKRRNIKIPVIIVTQFERFGELSTEINLAELKEELYKNFLDNYLGTVYYNPALNSWKDELGEILVKIGRSNL